MNLTKEQMKRWIQYYNELLMLIALKSFRSGYLGHFEMKSERPNCEEFDLKLELIQRWNILKNDLGLE